MRIIKRLSQEEKGKILHLISQGKNIKEISKILKRPYNTLYSFLIRSKLDKKEFTYQKKNNSTKQLEFEFIPKKTSRYLNFAEREFIEECLKKNIIISEIEKKLNRSNKAIHREVKKNGGKELYNAEKAQKKAENGRKKVNRLELNERMENLEMQMEILIETIRKFKKKND